jgi:OmcA/MtrC family decaheme c-type cytochrome
LPPNATTAEVIAAAAADPANDSATNSSSAFLVMQRTTVPAVQVSSPPVVNFTVFSDGKVVQGLTNANVRFAIAKLTPSTDGNPDEWASYVYSKETAAPPNGPDGTPVLTEAWRATTDPNTPAQLVYNADGYYTYTFKTDITDPAQTHGVVYEPGKTHRIAIQLSYKNAAGETVLVNPYFDFTIGADGKSVTVTDPNATRYMVNVANCNGCHEKLGLHGGGRVDVQYCVMCHNPGTTDASSGNVLTMATMTHKIHAGRGLANAAGGEHYTIWGYQNSKHDYSEVGFPQDLRNCNVCHTNSSSDPAKNTPQGDNWQTRVSKDACLTCHASNPGSAWNTSHTTYFGGTDPKTMTNAQCVACHNPTSNPTLSPGRVHWNQNEENSAKYKVNIESVAFNDTADKKGRTVTVKYYVSDPTNGDAAYNLVTPDCTYTGTAGICVPPSGTTNNTKFGNLRFYLAYQNIDGQFNAVTEFSSYNNGGSGANAYLHMGTNDGSNRYTLNIPVPDDTATAIAKGTARVVGIGQVKEVKLQAKSAADPRPPVVPTTYVNVVVQHTYKDVALSGPLLARREVVSNEKCNVCHGALGTTSGSNTLASAFHSGARNTVEACTLCHDANRFSSTVMTNGLALSENYSFKRMIHGIHGNSKRAYPFTHGNAVIGIFGKDGILTADGWTSGTVGNATVGGFLPYATTTPVAKGSPFASGVENYAAEVAWPGVGINCNACHVNNSYQQDLGTLGAVVSKPVIAGTTAPIADTNPNSWLVISPKAASCTACHDSSAAMGHVTSFGGSSFGDKTQGQIALLPRETCNDCHSPGGFKGVDIVHGLK